MIDIYKNNIYVYYILTFNFIEVYMNRYYHIYAENNPNCFNESSNRISSLKFRVILNDVCKTVAVSGLPNEKLQIKYPNYQIKNAAFKTSCNLLK